MWRKPDAFLSPVGGFISQLPGRSMMRIVNQPVVNIPRRLELQLHASGSCEALLSVKHQEPVGRLSHAAVCDPSAGVCFLPVSSNVVWMSLHRRAHARPCTCAPQLHYWWRCVPASASRRFCSSTFSELPEVPDHPSDFTSINPGCVSAAKMI